jgi:hypothetical protein
MNFCSAAADSPAGAATTALTGTDSAAAAVNTAVDNNVSNGFLRMFPPADHIGQLRCWQAGVSDRSPLQASDERTRAQLKTRPPEPPM